jgi:hypothetical protein
MSQDIIDAYNSIKGAIELPEAPDVNYDELLAVIRIRVEELLAADPSLLFSFLYRLDVLECDLKAVMAGTNSNDVIDSISELILKRQLDRLATRRLYKQEPIKDWSW